MPSRGSPTFSFRLDKAFAATIDEFCNEEGISRTELLRSAMLEYIQGARVSDFVYARLDEQDKQIAAAVVEMKNFTASLRQAGTQQNPEPKNAAAQAEAFKQLQNGLADVKTLMADMQAKIAASVIQSQRTTIATLQQNFHNMVARCTEQPPIQEVKKYPSWDEVRAKVRADVDGDTMNYELATLAEVIGADFPQVEMFAALVVVAAIAKNMLAEIMDGDDEQGKILSIRIPSEKGLFFGEKKAADAGATFGEFRRGVMSEAYKKVFR